MLSDEPQTPIHFAESVGAPEGVPVPVVPETPEPDGAPEEPAPPEPYVPEPEHPADSLVVVDLGKFYDSLIEASTALPEGYVPPVPITGLGILVEGDRLRLADLEARVAALEGNPAFAVVHPGP